MLINLHGGGQRWWDMNFQQQLEIAAEMGMKRGFDMAELTGKRLIVLDPNTAERWNADSLDTMLDYFLANYPEIDKDRVYVMGYSAGVELLGDGSMNRRIVSPRQLLVVLRVVVLRTMRRSLRSCRSGGWRAAMMGRTQREFEEWWSG